MKTNFLVLMVFAALIKFGASAFEMANSLQGSIELAPSSDRGGPNRDT